ncbi:MAG: hypothetical protein KKF67_01365 [Nanoarchaeota archaeon]|nr:hypothetical protein [Nanoarchaeota archaeon]
MLSRTYIDNFLLGLSENTTQVALEIDCYLEENPFGTEYIHFPTAKELTEQLLSKKATLLTRYDFDLYNILVPTGEKGKSSEEERQKLEEKKNSLVSKLRAINYQNPEELKRFRDFLICISNSALRAAHK